MNVVSHGALSDLNFFVFLSFTALHLSACEGNNKIVEFLLLPMSKGDPAVVDRWGISPLFDAIKHG